jgi:large subunit ribosomal protein L5
MSIPKIEKIILNFGVKETILDKKKLIPVLTALELISNQKYLLTKSRKSIIQFKIRKNHVVGCKVTLRKEKMFTFLDKFITLVLPRVRSFKGFPLNFDGMGNFSYTLTDLLSFYELDSEYDKFYKLNPLNITIVTTAKNNIESKFLLSSFQMPFLEKDIKKNKKDKL